MAFAYGFGSGFLSVKAPFAKARGTAYKKAKVFNAQVLAFLQR